MCSIVQKNWMQKLIWLSFVSRIYIYQNGLFILNDFVIHTYYKFRPTNRKKIFSDIEVLALEKGPCVEYVWKLLI